MPSFIALELLIALCVVPCILCWILGEMHGAARMRALLASAGGVAEAFAPVSPPLLQPVPKTAASTEQSRASETPDTTTPVEECLEETSRTPAEFQADAPSVAERIESRQRRATFDDMPSLADLHEQAKSIRSSARLWDDGEALNHLRESDPVSDRVLRHYQGSIGALAGSASQAETKAGSKPNALAATSLKGARSRPVKRLFD